MKKLALAVGLSTVFCSTIPAFAMDSGSSGQTKATDFRALNGIQASIELDDQELAKVEGAQGPVGQVGLVNANVQNVLNNNNVEVIKNVNANVSVLSAGGQLIRH